MKYIPKLLVSGKDKFVQIQVLNDDDTVPNKVNEACVPAHDATPELIDAIAKDLMRRIGDERTPVLTVDEMKVAEAGEKIIAVEAVMPLGIEIVVTNADIEAFAYRLGIDGSVRAVAENGEKYTPKHAPGPVVVAPVTNESTPSDPIPPESQAEPIQA